MENDLTPEQVLDKATKLGYDANRYEQTDPKWKSPEEFLDFGERLNPILRENNKRLEAQLAARDAQIAAIQTEIAKFAKVHEETAKAAYAKALAELKADKKLALEHGDYDTVVEIDERIADTRAAEKATPTPAYVPPAVNPQVDVVEQQYQDWANLPENSWLRDPEMETYARAAGELLVKQGTLASGANFKPFLDKVATKVRERFPEHFENNSRRDVAKVDGGGSGSAESSGRKGRYSSLPQEAKEACDLLINTIPGFTREKYVATYKW